MTNQDKLIIALDLNDPEEALSLVETIGEAANFYKIGYQLSPVGGIDLARTLKANGKKIFLDWKLHDIATTVERGVRNICKLGLDIVTVHAEPDVLAGAVAGRGEDPSLKIFGVTVLTSLDQRAIERAGISMPIADLVLKRAEFAAEAGADGVIASAQEASAIKARFGNSLEIVTPGIRPAGAASNDQKRVVTPADAIKAGADYLVVGRPIVAAETPKNAAQAIQNEIFGAI